jgi:hypothetical protein
VSNNFCPVATALSISNGCGELLRVVVDVPDVFQTSGIGRIGLELLDQRAVNLGIVRRRGKRWRSSSNDSGAIVMSVTYAP